jgi:hypothetical protein
MYFFLIFFQVEPKNWQLIFMCPLYTKNYVFLKIFFFKDFGYKGTLKIYVIVNKNEGASKRKGNVNVYLLAAK